MSEYLVVRKHPHGGFAVVLADTDDTGIQDVDPTYHLQHGTLRQAERAAFNESELLGGIAYTVEPCCYQD